jgi:type IV pilus assembly protein PilC
MSILSLTIPEEISPAHAANARINQADLIMFTTQLSVMLESGVVLSDALDAIAQQCRPGIFKAILTDVAQKIINGSSFSVALEAYPRTFDPMFVNLVRASEASGRMSEMLTVLSRYLDAEANTRKQIKSAMVYPFIMMMMAIAATGTLMFFVLPRFMRIYESRGAALPKLTMMLVNFSKILGDAEKMSMIVTTLVCLIFGGYFWIQTASGRRCLDFIKVRTPVIGTMFVDSILTRSMRIIATMIKTGVSLLDAIEVTKNSCQNSYFQELWLAVDDKIRAGHQFSESLQVAPNSSLISPGVIQMLKAGEKSGKLGHVCEKMSTFYEKKLESSIKSVTTLIEPVMILVMGLIIGTIAIALLLPVFRISSVLAH